MTNSSDGRLTPTRNTRRDIRRAILFMTIAIAILPLMNVTAKYLSAEYPTTQIVWARYAGHFIFVLLIFLPSRGLRLFRARRLGVHLVRSILMFICTLLFFWALRYIDVPVASSINLTSPMIVTALAVPFLGEKVEFRRWLAVLAGFAGALIIIWPGGATAHWAMFLVAGTALLYAIYQILTRKVATEDSAETSLAYIALVGTVILTIALPFDYRIPTSWTDAGLHFFVGVVGGTGHFFIIQAFRLGEASVLAPFNYGQLIMATVASYFVFDTLPDAMTWLGAAIIVASGIYITLRESRAGRSKGGG